LHFSFSILISQRAWTCLFHLLHKLTDQLGKPSALGCRNPFQSQPFLSQTQQLDQLFGDFEPLRGPVIAKGVMAIADVSPGPHHAVGAFFERPQHVRRADSPGAHHPDQSHVGRILHSAHPGRIRACV
jgi:hypothetical protein